MALGANQPYRRRTPLESLRGALDMLDAAGARVISASRPFRTPAWPNPADPPYVNAVAAVDWSGEADALLELLHRIEARNGRTRSVLNAPRPLDLDLIDHRGEILSGSGGRAVLPHPRAQFRAFVLLPLRDVAPAWTHPVSGDRLDQLIGRLPAADRRAATPIGAPLRTALAP